MLDDESDIPEELRASMPDKNDPKVRTKLICSACHWQVVELYNELAEIQRKWGKKRPKQYVLDDMFEDFCERHTNDYGLHVDDENKVVKPKFTKLAAKLQGAWISRIFDNECSAFVDNFQMQFKKRNWDVLRDFFSSGSIKEEKLHTLCPICKNPDADGAYIGREETLEWMDKKTKMIEDWDL